MTPPVDAATFRLDTLRVMDAVEALWDEDTARAVGILDAMGPDRAVTACITVVSLLVETIAHETTPPADEKHVLALVRQYVEIAGMP